MNAFDARARGWDSDPVKVERARSVAAAIRREMTLTRNTTALEYGCGTGLLSFFLQPHLGPITLADSSAGMLEVLAEKIAAAKVKNMTPLFLDLAVDPLPTARFDLVYCLMVLHHIPDTAKILEGFHALLNPGGRLAIADLDKEDGSFHSEPFDGHKGFDRHQLRRMLKQAGFVKIHFTNCYEQMKNGRRYPLFLAVAEKAGKT
jgi:ubiquinone/menaquinone biosynthesis C-methylase UbiE